jgi:hypothetical protein
MWLEQSSVETFHRIYAKSEPAVACISFFEKSHPRYRRTAAQQSYD